MNNGWHCLQGILMMLSLTSCSSTSERPYGQFADNHFRGVPAPTAESISQHAAESFDLQEDIQLVWLATLLLIQQRGGILFASAESPDTRMVLFIDTPTRRGGPEYLDRMHTSGVGESHVESWLAIKLSAIGPARTRVQISWVDPITARPRSLEEYRNSQARDADVIASAEASLVNFRSALELQVAIPDEWNQALAASVPTGALRESVLVPRLEQPSDYAHASQVGNRLSRRIRERAYVINFR